MAIRRNIFDNYNIVGNTCYFGILRDLKYTAAGSKPCVCFDKPCSCKEIKSFFVIFYVTNRLHLTYYFFRYCKASKYNIS